MNAQFSNTLWFVNYGLHVQHYNITALLFYFSIWYNLDLKYIYKS